MDDICSDDRHSHIYFLTSDLTMKTVTVGNLLKSGIATLNDPTQKKVYILKFMVYLNQYFPVIDTTDLWATEGRNIPPVIDDEFDVVTEAHPGAIVQDVAARRGYRRIYRHVPKTWRSHTDNTPIIRRYRDR
jgi:hypothetical protein